MLEDIWLKQIKMIETEGQKMWEQSTEADEEEKTRNIKESKN